MARKLHLIQPNQPAASAVPAPPRPLGEHGAALWAAVNREHDVSDAAGAELLCAAAQALDRAESCRLEIERDGGPALRRDGVIRDHPLLRHELSAMAFATRTLHRLGLDVEPIRTVSRPAGR